MGLLSFAVNRCVDIFLPGVGAALDMFEVLEAIDSLKDGYDAQEVADAIQTVKDAADSSKEICGKKIRRQACSICRKPGHNRRTCPQL